MLALPEARLVLPTLGLALAASPPLLLQLGGTPGLPRRRTLPPWQGLALAAAVLLAVAAARFALFDVVAYCLGRRPSEALMAGVLVLAAAGGCLPLVRRYYSHSAPARRALLLAAAAGLLLTIMRPPLPIAGGAECPRLPFGLCPRLWNEAHTPGEGRGRRVAAATGVCSRRPNLASSPHRPHLASSLPTSLCSVTHAQSPPPAPPKSIRLHPRRARGGRCVHLGRRPAPT